MGSSRAILASASTPSTMMQTHSPSGSSTPLTQALDKNCSIKSEHMDAAVNAHCRSENWAESYQDLSSWCSATSPCLQATSLLPATDETLITELDFQGEIDFDLRKSEEIASIPLEEDISSNLWGTGNLLLGDSTSPTSLVPPVPFTGTGSSNPALLKDCWWFKSENDKSGRVFELNGPLTFTNTSASIQSAAAVKEEVMEIKENMNPAGGAPHILFSDPVKKAELQVRLERIASRTHPDVNSREKAADLMKILQDQIAILNKKKLRSPAAVSDLHNYHSKVQVMAARTSVTPVLNAQVTAVTAPVLLGDAAGGIFYSDPFDGLFPSPSEQTDQIIQQPDLAPKSVENSTSLNSTAVPSVHAEITSRSHQTNENGSGRMFPHDLGGNDLFVDAHSEVMKEAIKMQRSQPTIQITPELLVNSQSVNQNSLTQNFTQPSVIQAKKGKLTIQLPNPRVNTSENDINFDALLFGSPSSIGSIATSTKMPPISTPEVIKSLVETPDPESFDLLSYLCDDKANTPSVYLESSSNPFRFPQPASKQSTFIPTPSSLSEQKSNVMVVKPLTPGWTTEDKNEMRGNGSDSSSVLVEIKPQIMPISTLSDVEEGNEEEENVVDSKWELQKRLSESVTEVVSPRPLRSPRKRKYSDDYVFSPSPSEESTKPSRRRRTTSSKYDSDEEFTLPVRKSRKRASASPAADDDCSKKKKSRASAVPKRAERTVSTSSESDRYRELRDRNNEASRKSRLTRKAREQELGKQAEHLAKENRVLKVKVEEMENLVKRLREALLQSMMKKS